MAAMITERRGERIGLHLFEEAELRRVASAFDLLLVSLRAGHDDGGHNSEHKAKSRASTKATIDVVMEGQPVAAPRRCRPRARVNVEQASKSLSGS